MEFTLTQDFPAGLASLWGVFGNPDYVQRKYRALGATAVRVRRFQASAGTIEVELERDMAVPRARLPVWARALVGRRQMLTHRSVWRRDGPHQATAELDIVPAGLPVRAHALGTLDDGGHGLTRMVLNWRVDSPLGERVAKLFAQQVRTALNEDHAFTLSYLQLAAKPYSRQVSSDSAP